MIHKLISDDKGMNSILNLTFSNICTEKNSTVTPTLLNIFHGHDKEKCAITEVHKCKYLQKIYINKSTVLMKYYRRYLKNVHS